MSEHLGETIADVRPSVTMRRLDAGDLEAIASLCDEAALAGESAEGPAPMDRAYLRSRLFGGDPKFEAYGLHEGGRLVAWGALAPHTYRPVYNVCAEISLVVATARRRRGLGRKLAAHLFERAQELRFHTLLVVLPSEPTHPLAWAVRLGFRSAGGLSGALQTGDDNWCDVFIMQKFLEHTSQSGEPGQ
jgi:L-amino acid N-acyltransferase YncA